MLERIYSLLSDERLPHYLPYTILKKFLVARRIKKSVPKELMVALTFDVEPDPLSENHEMILNFLSRIEKVAKENSTFFVQGDLINELAYYLRELQKRNEIGLHGFAHELWGDEKWWIDKNALNLKEKTKLLTLALSYFKKNGLKRPISFRAPYAIINRGVLNLLKKFDFIVDSSASSYEGVPPLPNSLNGLTIIPVTANPIPKFSVKKMIPYCYYEIFTAETVLPFNRKELLDFITIVTSFQKTHHCIPHLVFIGHPWEFVKFGGERNYSSPKNYKLLKRVCSTLEKNCKVRYVTMKELSRKL